MVNLNVNGKGVQLDAPEEMPLLWALRDVANLTGTKFGCGMALCGACTVHVDGAATRSCITPVGSVAGKKITTIEAVGQLANDKVGRAVQASWRKLDVAQCGYCQSGQIMSATALLAQNPKPTDADIDAAMSGNICRCATYVRIRAAIHDAAKTLA
ncbi:MAG TPA: (2Fe-2S)-binding protein [Burkholderiaceae bacterium]|nr:(2Fe-2S)-binding protein [Burkholderiaceae bacterium]